MSGSGNKVAVVSVAIALVCAAWAIYATKHERPVASFGPPGMGGPASPGRSGGPPRMAGAAARPVGAGPVPVVSQVVATESLARSTMAVGTARANESVEITAKTSNLIAAVRFTDGQSVARGAVLVELDSAQARADLAAAAAELTESVSQYSRARELFATQLVSRSQFEQLEATKLANAARVAAARARLEDTQIRAPFDGRVGLRRISVGSLISPGTVITTLDDTSVIKLDFAVPENTLAMLREGLEISATTSAYPERRFSGTVQSIDSRVDATTRAVTLRALIPNPDGALKPGMFMNVELTKDQRTAVVIPEEALVPEQNKQFVFVIEGEHARKREVTIGARRPGSVEVVAGLAAGERIIVEGTVKIRDGGEVRDLAAVSPSGPGGRSGP
jgi:membrane fusion protein (multidrug efflux system)